MAKEITYCPLCDGETMEHLGISFTIDTDKTIEGVCRDCYDKELDRYEYETEN